MRLFTAIAISGEVRATLIELLRRLKPTSKQNWSPPDNLHITTKFIGEWPEMRFEELCDALRAVPKPGPFDVTLRGLGWFPNPHNPNAFFAGIEAPMALSELAKSTDAACIRLGIPAESKRYVPHMTLARIKSSEGLAELRKAVAGVPTVDFGRFTVRSFQLYESQPGPGSSKYIPVEEFPLL